MANDTHTESDRISELEERLHWLERLVEEHVLAERVRPIEERLRRHGVLLN